jgi:hypothetical protein
MGKVSKQQSKSTTIIKVLSISTAIISIINFWVAGLINGNFYTSDFRLEYSILLLAFAAFALVGLILSIIASIRVSGRQKYIYIVCVLISLAAALLQIISAALFNALR